MPSPSHHQIPSELRLVLPAYRENYDIHDFKDIDFRRTDEEVAKYLVSVEEWPRWRRARRLVLQIPGVKPCAQSEQKTISSYRAMLNHHESQHFRSIMRLVPIIILLIIAGLSMIYFSHLIPQVELQETFRKTMAEVVRVGGWVAMWTAVGLLFYDGARMLNRFLAFRRLKRLPIVFDYQIRDAPLASRTPGPNPSAELHDEAPLGAIN